MSRRWLPIAVCSLLLALAVSGKARDDKQPAPDSKEIAKLIKDLSADEFDVREAASRKLTALGEAAASAVQEALKSPDAETSRRAREIFKEVERRREERELKKLLAEFDKTPLDKLISHIAKNPEKVTDAEWKAMGKLVEAAVAQTNKVAGTTFKVPVDITALKTETNPHGTGGNNIRFVTAGFTQPYTSFGNSVIICSGNTKHITGVSNAVVIVDGNFEGATGIDHSIIVCRGSFQRVTVLQNSIVLCGGSFDRANGIDKSVIQATSFGRCTTTNNNVYINLPEVAAAGRAGDRYVTTKADPLSLLRFTPKKNKK